MNSMIQKKTKGFSLSRIYLYPTLFNCIQLYTCHGGRSHGGAFIYCSSHLSFCLSLSPLRLSPYPSCFYLIQCLVKPSVVYCHLLFCFVTQPLLTPIFALGYLPWLFLSFAFLCFYLVIA